MYECYIPAADVSGVRSCSSSVGVHGVFWLLVGGIRGLGRNTWDCGNIWNGNIWNGNIWDE